jgi:DNA-binding NtrC family response regulator
MSRVMLCHGRADEELALRSNHLDVLLCEDTDTLVDEVVVHRPDVVIYELRSESQSDLAVLRLLRRVAPRLPLVVVGEDETSTWDTPADLAPLVFTARPAGERGLQGTVDDALALQDKR